MTEWIDPAQYIPAIGRMVQIKTVFSSQPCYATVVIARQPYRWKGWNGHLEWLIGNLRAHTGDVKAWRYAEEEQDMSLGDFLEHALAEAKAVVKRTMPRISIERVKELREQRGLGLRDARAETIRELLLKELSEPEPDVIAVLRQIVMNMSFR